MQPQRFVPSLAKGLALGAASGLLLFAVEGAAVRSGAAGLNLDVEGPFAAVIAAVRPLLPGLLMRIALTCALGGAVLGLGAGALAWVTRPQRLLPVVAAELVLLWGLLAWVHAIWRPALFDDVPPLRSLLAPLVRGGEPWHVAVAGGLLLLVHVRIAARAPRRWQRLAGVAGVSVLLGVTPPPAPARGPLLLLVGIDAFRPDRLGRGVAPNLDAFVGDATLYRQAFTPIAQTEPAWRSLLTARWPHVAGSRYPLTAESRWPSLPVFPAAFAAAGYSTHFETDCSRFNFQSAASGFADRRQPPRGALNFALEKLRFRTVGLVGDNAVGAALVPELVDNRAMAGIHDPMGFAERLAGRIVDAARAGPTLYAFHATAAHFPGDPTYPFYRRYLGDDAPLERRLRMVFTPIASEAHGPGGWSRPQSEALYDELLGQADAQLGVILGALKDAGLYDDAFIIVFSDHGESFHADVPALAGATPVHGARLGEEENRILLAVKPPHAKGAATVDKLVRLIDIGPTLLEAAGLPALAAADGVPLSSGADLLLYAETGFTHASPAAFDEGHLSRAPRTFDSYAVRPDGVIEMSPAAHDGVLAEKDVGAFDGVHWLVRSPRADGTTVERCDANCEALTSFLDTAVQEKP